MKLFKFHPTPFLRIYMIANSEDEVLKNSKKLFDEYVAEYYDWIEFDNPYDRDELEQIHENFMNGLKTTLTESETNFFVDAHY